MGPFVIKKSPNLARLPEMYVKPRFSVMQEIYPEVYPGNSITPKSLSDTCVNW